MKLSEEAFDQQSSSSTLGEIEAIASSKVRLKIANLISSRPATLSELSALTGISVQGVLKHLNRIADEGLLREENMKSGRFLKQRKLYFIDKRKVADFSEGDLLLAALERVSVTETSRAKDAYEELDWLAQDVIILRRRAKDLSHRLQRLLVEVAEDEARMAALLSDVELTPDERQIAYLIFAEDSPERAREILRDHYGCLDPEGAMESVSAKLRGRRA